QRREEIGALEWSEIDMHAKLITLPASRTKNKRPHEVPLAGAALTLIENLPRRAGRSLVFGGGRGGWSGWSQSKRALDAGAGLSGGGALHALRRTAATRMADIGVLPHVIEAVLNHVGGHKAGVAGIYNRSTYAAEKRAALELWASHLRVAIA